MAIKCKSCGRTIQGNAATEEYDEAKQVNVYTCRPCNRMFRDILRSDKAYKATR